MSPGRGSQPESVTVTVLLVTQAELRPANRGGTARARARSRSHHVMSRRGGGCRGPGPGLAVTAGVCRQWR